MTTLRDRIVELRIRGSTIRDIAKEVGKSASTVRYHLWHDANDGDRIAKRGGWQNHRIYARRRALREKANRERSPLRT